MLAGSTLAKVWVGGGEATTWPAGARLRYGLHLPERVMLSTGSADREAACAAHALGGRVPWNWLVAAKRS